MKTRKKPKTIVEKISPSIRTARRRVTILDATIERAFPNLFVPRLNLEEGC
jgi:hypothetical protein